MDRVILHCDCNSFYASVETVLRPELANVPMAVCGDPKARHGIILAKNEHAKRFGVKTAETIREAKKKCPDLVLVAPHHQLYEEYSERIFAFYNTFTDQVEPFGIDEAWLDVTASRRLFGSGEEIADKIRRGVKERFGVTVSVGVSFNKAFAKLASDYKKPDAVTVFSPENWRERVFPLPVGDLLFVGHSAQTKLAPLGVKTIGDLARLSEAFLRENFGKTGELLHRYANGLDDSPVTVFGQGEPIKSIGNSFTFPRDLTLEEEIGIGLRALADRVASRLRRHGAKAASVSIVIKDSSLHSITRQMPLKTPTHLSDDLYDAARILVCSARESKKPIRMLGITANKLHFDEASATQISFFDDPGEARGRERREHREKAVDRIREKFGTGSIVSGSLYQNDLFSE
ncbi:MAG: DNA polymerase IV [Clostridia bacterium]|nr:DNA polymerase IV [Clostridia bacterium]